MSSTDTEWYDYISTLYDKSSEVCSLMGAILFYLGSNYKEVSEKKDATGPWAMVVIDDGDEPVQYLEANNETSARVMLATQFLLYCLKGKHEPDPQGLCELAAVLDGHANGLSASGDSRTDYFFITQQLPGEK